MWRSLLVGLFDNIPEPKEEDLLVEVEDFLLPEWAYSKEEWEEISSEDKKRGYRMIFVPRPTDSGYFR